MAQGIRGLGRGGSRGAQLFPRQLHAPQQPPHRIFSLLFLRFTLYQKLPGRIPHSSFSLNDWEQSGGQE